MSEQIPSAAGEEIDNDWPMFSETLPHVRLNPKNGSVAQLEEHAPDKGAVAGSKPVGTTSSKLVRIPLDEDTMLFVRRPLPAHFEFWYTMGRSHCTA
jgi:hypothetical protein